MKVVVRQSMFADMDSYVNVVTTTTVTISPTEHDSSLISQSIVDSPSTSDISASHSPSIRIHTHTHRPQQTPQNQNPRPYPVMPLPPPHQLHRTPRLLPLSSTPIVKCIRECDGAIAGSSQFVCADREGAVCATQEGEGVRDAGCGEESCWYVDAAKRGVGVVSEVGEGEEIDDTQGTGDLSQ